MSAPRLAPVVDLDLLADAARGGDQRAFEDLVRATYADVYTLAQRLIGDDDEARDVAQETYLRVYRSLGGFRGDARVSTWLYRITANTASSHRSRRARRRTEPLADDHPVVDLALERDPARRAEAGALRERVAAAVAELPPRLRAVIVLRDIYDLPHEAIAAELGISETAAKVRLHRARKRLHDHLADLASEQERPTERPTERPVEREVGGGPAGRTEERG